MVAGIPSLSWSRLADSSPDLRITSGSSARRLLMIGPRLVLQPYFDVHKATASDGRFRKYGGTSGARD
jgi:hypothetical protein